MDESQTEWLSGDVAAEVEAQAPTAAERAEPRPADADAGSHDGLDHDAAEDDGADDDAAAEAQREAAMRALRDKARASAAQLVATIAEIDRSQEAQGGGDPLVLPARLTSGALALRPHQLAGVAWIWQQWESGLGGCILADEMGLGKTAQALGTLAGLYERFRHTRRMEQLSARNPAALQAACAGGKWPRVPWLRKPPAQVTRLDLGTEGPHLIVAPTSLVSNWVAEARRFAGAMRCTALVGSREERKRILRDVGARPQRHHIVVTSYSMLDDDGVASCLQEAVPSWRCIVVDEAHNLKNSRTRRFQRLASLEGDFRLLLTGTPVQNSVREMLCLLRFASADLFGTVGPEASPDDDAAADEWDVVVEAFVHELSASDTLRAQDGAAGEAGRPAPSPPQAAAGAASAGGARQASLVDTIRRIMRPFILQRTKEDVALGLPPKRSSVRAVAMLPHQAALYGAIKGSLRLVAAQRRGAAGGAVEAERSRLAAGPFLGSLTGPVLSGRASSLPSAIMLMRRAAAHPALLRVVYPDALVLALVRAAHAVDAERADPPGSVRSDASVEQALASLRETAASLGATSAPSSARAAIAVTRRVDDDAGGPAPPAPVLRIKPAMHRAGDHAAPVPTLPELVAWAAGDRRLAKAAEQALGMSDFEVSEEVCSFYPRLDAWRLPLEYLCMSGKVVELLRVVEGARGRGAKTLVFSQFNIVLDILRPVLEAAGAGCLRLDGSTPSAERQALCDRFSADASVTAFLLTTRAGGVGLNLTAADTVVLFDCDWNPQNDRQAEDRAHRMGQTRPVTVVRLASAGTIEQRMLEVAERKRRLERVILDAGGPRGDGPASDDDFVRRELDDEEEGPAGETGAAPAAAGGDLTTSPERHGQGTAVAETAAAPPPDAAPAPCPRAYAPPSPASAPSRAVLSAKPGPSAASPPSSRPAGGSPPPKRPRLEPACEAATPPSSAISADAKDDAPVAGGAKESWAAMSGAAAAGTDP